MAGAELAATHRRRLREVWRSAGWPCRDPIELDLLAAGLLQRQWDDQGRETLRVIDKGIQVLADTRLRNQAAFSAHEALVQRVAQEMQRAGRVVWRGLRADRGSGRTRVLLEGPSAISRARAEPARAAGGRGQQHAVGDGDARCLICRSGRHSLG